MKTSRCHRQARGTRVTLLLSAVATLATACSKGSLPDPPARSVIVDNAKCYTNANGIDVPVACPDDTVPVDGLLGTPLSGVNGAPVPLFSQDAVTNLAQGFSTLNASELRIPVGYGCAASLQGIWKGSSAADVDDIANYDLTAFESVLGSVRGANAQPIWTAAYSLGGDCTYSNGQQVGTGIADASLWAKVVRRIARYYDRDLPMASQSRAACTGTSDWPWQCSPAIFNIEFGRDPFGAGGFADTPAGSDAWLAAYTQFATELRLEFTEPGNDVRLIAPSVVMSSVPGDLSGDAPARSKIYDFIDYVVAQQLPLTDLSLELEVCTPLEARQIVLAVSAYAAQKGLRAEKNFSSPTGKTAVTDLEGQVVGHVNDGTEPIPIRVSDLRLKCPSAAAAESPAQQSAHLGAVFAGARILLQGLVKNATMGAAQRFATVALAAGDAAAASLSANASDFLWFGQSGVADGLPKPAAWPEFWFSSGFLSDLQQLGVVEGPDALGLGGQASSDRASGVLLMATRQTCLDAAGNVKNCVDDPSTSSHPEVDANRQHILHILLVDMDLAAPAAPEHELTVQLQGLPKTATSIGFRWADMDGTAATWCVASSTSSDPTPDCTFKFNEFGVNDLKDGVAQLTRKVAVPSMHYLEVLY